MFEGIREVLGGMSSGHDESSAGGVPAAPTTGPSFSNEGPIPPVTGEGGQQKPSASDQAFGAKAEGPVAAGLEAELPPRPPKFAKMPQAAVDLLWRSRNEYPAIASGPPELGFWGRVERMTASELQVLVQITTGATNLGLMQHIHTLQKIYNYGSSWGIEFGGDPQPITSNGQWGEDFPQDVVRGQHFNTPHTWYRNNSGAGNPGMHLGILPGGHHNVHWDPTNPMYTVSTGGFIPIPGSPLPIYVPRGMAVYHPAHLMDHAEDIGFLDKDPNKKDKPRGSEPWYSMQEVTGYGKGARDFVGSEEGLLGSGEVGDIGRAKQVIARVRAAAASADQFELDARGLASQDFSKDENALKAFQTKWNAVQHEFFASLADYFSHLYADSFLNPDGTDPRVVENWTVKMGIMDWANRKRESILQQRHDRYVAKHH